jgi:hypothetical protein
MAQNGFGGVEAEHRTAELGRTLTALEDRKKCMKTE